MIEEQKMQGIKYISNEEGIKTDVVIPYDAFIELLEEIEDLKTILQRKDEETVPHCEVLKIYEKV